ncbi:MAG: hypothetical protein IPI35_01530 [Deltaproteobacteria bacterium]|nr:hypothetical protein [Deltaproteobacteria bacterium]
MSVPVLVSYSTICPLDVCPYTTPNSSDSVMLRSSPPLMAVTVVQVSVAGVYL